MISRLAFAFVALLSLLAGGSVRAALIDRGGGLFYDTVLNVTWLQNANYGAGSIYDNGTSATDGVMSWANAVQWAADLSYFDSVRGVTWNDWRLPHALPVNGSTYNYSLSNDGTTDQGWNITSPQSELSYMFYVNLGNKGLHDTSGNSQGGEGLVNTGPFINIGSADWTGTVYNGPDVGSAPFAFDFIMGGGTQSRAYIPGADHSAWAVRDGDVGTATVPEPGSLALWCGVVALLAGAARRKLRR